ncbi:MAG TPA: hypothetical protein VGU21_08265, partial [Streptosporangiaceae bacterium]|nr:hypothetical protein [Streptosporangiaceae bacterium]
MPGTPAGLPAGLVPSRSAEPSGHTLAESTDLGGYPPAPPGAPPGYPPGPGHGQFGRHGASSPARKPSPAKRRARRSRIAALAIVIIGVLVVGLA